MIFGAQFAKHPVLMEEIVRSGYVVAPVVVYHQIWVGYSCISHDTAAFSGRFCRKLGLLVCMAPQSFLEGETKYLMCIVDGCPPDKAVKREALRHETSPEQAKATNEHQQWIDGWTYWDGK